MKFCFHGIDAIGVLLGEVVQLIDIALQIVEIKAAVLVTLNGFPVAHTNGGGRYPTLSAAGFGVARPVDECFIVGKRRLR